VGTLNAICTLMLHSKLQCQGTFGSTDHIAITGGTGTFRGASGEVLSTSISDNVSRDVIHLD
jgi:hypothetical protein